MNRGEVAEALNLLRARDHLLGALRHLENGGSPVIIINGLQVCGDGKLAPVDVTSAIRMHVAADEAVLARRLAELGVDD